MDSGDQAGSDDDVVYLMTVKAPPSTKLGRYRKMIDDLREKRVEYKAARLDVKRAYQEYKKLLGPNGAHLPTFKELYFSNRETIKKIFPTFS